MYFEQSQYFLPRTALNTTLSPSLDECQTGEVIAVAGKDLRLTHDWWYSMTGDKPGMVTYLLLLPCGCYL